MIKCQTIVVSKLDRTDFYLPSTSNELVPLFQNEVNTGYIVGAYVGKHLAGFASVAKCSNLYHGYCCDKGKNCYSIEDTIVKPEYRGNAIQKKLWKYIITLLPKNVSLLCTIHPENIYSLHNALALHFIPQKLIIYETMPRLVLELFIN